jgi:putative competence protein
LRGVGNMKIKHVVIFVILLTAGNFLRLYIEDKNIPDIEISEEASYKKDKAKKENDLSKTDKKFDVNSVTYDELLKLGFQKSKAEKIIEFRDEMGIISDIKEMKYIPRFGDAGVKQAKKYLYVDTEKIKNPSENYNGKNLRKYNINSIDEDTLKMLGFTKKEITKLMPEIKNGNVRSNIDLEKIIGSERYEEVEKRIKYSE